MKIHRTSQKKSARFSVSLIFLIVLVGFLSWAYEQITIPNFDSLIPNDVAFFGEVTLSPRIIEKLKPVFNTEDLSLLAQNLTNNQFELDFQKDVFPNIGDHIGVALWENKEFAVIMNQSSRSQTEALLQKFILPGEAFQKKKESWGELWTPNFSSQLAFGFYKNYVILGSSKETVEKIGSSSSKLNQNHFYQSIKQEKPDSSFFSVYINSEKILPYIFSQKFVSMEPLLKATTKAFPGIGFFATFDDQGVVINGKMMADENIFPDKLQLSIPLFSKEATPLAQFSGKDTLLFTNGQNLFAKYQDTKDFLGRFDSQWSLIFEGIIRGRMRDIFGENMDFEKDILPYFNGPYAIILNEEETPAPFLSYTLVTQLQKIDGKSLALDEIIKKAQSHFAPQIKTVELPDGTKREELVASEKITEPLEKVSFGKYTYFRVPQSSDPTKKFSYGFADDYFLFSTNDTGIKKALTALTSGQNLLTTNAIKQSINLNLGKPDSFSYLNFEKFSALASLLKVVQQDTNTPPEIQNQGLSVTNLILSKFKDAIFTRKTSSQGVTVKAILFFH